MVLTGRDDDQPVDASLAKRADQLALAIGILVAAAREDEHTALARRVLDRAVQRRRERVRHVLEHEADRLRFAAEPAEHRRVRVPAIVQLLDCLPDLRLELGAHAGLAVHDARNRLQADARERGDVDHRRAASRRDYIL